LVGEPEGKRRRWIDNIKMDLGQIGWLGCGLDGLAQDRGYDNAIMNVWLQ
jgi:hypothetical protein